jgi:AcrR family transcriptional regulator
VVDVSAPATGMRDIAREAIRARVQDVALDLFDEYGFDEVTVEQVAAEVGISARSFHRYFLTKEDAVVGDLGRYGDVVRDGFAARPATEPVWTSLRQAFQTMLEVSDIDDDRSKKIMRVTSSVASLRARTVEKHSQWAELLTPLVKARLTGPDRDLRAQTTVQAAIDCFHIALMTWATTETTAAADKLLQRAFDSLQPR